MADQSDFAKKMRQAMGEEPIETKVKKPGHFVPETRPAGPCPACGAQLNGLWGEYSTCPHCGSGIDWHPDRTREVQQKKANAKGCFGCFIFFCVGVLVFMLIFGRLLGDYWSGRFLDPTIN